MLGDKARRRIERAIGEPVLRAWAHGGYVMDFVTPDHRHGSWHKVTGEWEWHKDPQIHYTSCREWLDDDKENAVSTTRVTLYLPNTPEVTPGQVLTEEAVAGMVGQTPVWAPNLDWQHAGGRVTVVDASIDGDNVLITVDVDERSVRPAWLEGLEQPFLGGIGYTVDDSEGDRVSKLALRTTGPLAPR